MVKMVTVCLLCGLTVNLLSADTCLFSQLLLILLTPVKYRSNHGIKLTSGTLNYQDLILKDAEQNVIICAA